MSNIVKSEQYNSKEAVYRTLEKYQAKLLKKDKDKVYYQSLNTGMIIVISKVGYLYKLDYYKNCGLCV